MKFVHSTDLLINNRKKFLGDIDGNSSSSVAVRKFVVNGKFFSDELTGVHRVGTELIRHCHKLLADDRALATKLNMELWVPPRGRARAEALGVPFQVVSPLEGVAWGQFTLPFRARSRTILSLGNVGPVLARNAVTMIQDAQVRSTPESYAPLFRAWYRFHQPISGRRHRRILTVSEFSQDQLAHYRIAKREWITVIPNAADHVLRERPDDGIVARLNLTPGRYVVALSNIQPHKNIGLLLKAFARPELERFTLVLFGAAGRKAFAEAGFDASANVCFADRLGDGELWGLYRQALCLAFPSLTEGFGLPPLEAMMLGCPVLAAPAGALPETCGDAALFVDPFSVEDWRDAILSVAGSPRLRQGLIVRGRAWANRFSWSASASRLVAVLLAL